MGNCLGTRKKSPAEIAPSELIKPAPVISPKPELIKPAPLIKLYGHPDSFATSHIRLALSYKPVRLQFVPSDAQQNPTIMYKSDVVTGSVEEILRYLDAKFPDSPVAVTSNVWGWCGAKTPAVVWVVMLQHRSMSWHLERMVKWAGDMGARGGNASGDPSMGSPRMEVKKFAKSYSHLHQLLLEHAQMEEIVMFQILESADRGLCKSANEDHARDLPVMNGVKEEIKIVGVMNVGSPDYQEALTRLLSRLNKLKENCKQHFEEEERELLPLMEATELNKLQQEKVLQQSLDAMRETHSHLFRFFMEGLCPQDGMHYFGLIKRYCDNARVSLMLHMMVD
ncbi:uncharacterized protein LOC121761274 [Salvia splendens]|uniref:uncharacterized protein LOC121761274 n=1 Tax=Salvia splendens TaxID=180675 RepID=UPI001103642C|nr:uncharacterized protein LOC121761274 [Salvia splendens]